MKSSSLRSAELLLEIFTVKSASGAGSAVTVAVWEISPSLMLLGAVMVSFGAVKLTELDTVPPAVVTEIGPVVTPVGAVAVIEVALFTVNEAAATPLNRTAVAPVKSVPVIVTIVPAKPKVGLISVIAGGVPPPPAAVREMLSIAIPEEFPVSVPRHMAQRTCTTA